MITTLAVSYQHLITLVIILFIISLPIYFLVKSKKNNDEKVSIDEINNLGSENLRYFDERYKQKLERNGKISEKTNLITYILTVLFLIIYTIFYTLKNRSFENLNDSAYLVGTILAIIITSTFYISIFTLLFNPIRKLYKRFIQYNDGIVSNLTFKKYIKRSMMCSIILSVFTIGIFGLFLIPHYIFLSDLKKIKL